MEELFNGFCCAPILDNTVCHPVFSCFSYVGGGPKLDDESDRERGAKDGRPRGGNHQTHRGAQGTCHTQVIPSC